MNKLFLARSAFLALALAGPAYAADVPRAVSGGGGPFVPSFSWTGCYLGGHLGGGWAQKEITDPVQLVQDSFLGAGSTVGVTRVNSVPSGVVIGGQIGCDYQVASNWVVGIEGAASGSTMKGSTSVLLPLGNPGDTAQVSARTDFLPSVTARLGYAFDHMLFYAKGGAAWAGDKYTVTGIFAGTGFGFEGLDTRTGWITGAGVDWAFARHWSARLEYDYYQFGHGSVLMSDSINVLSGLVDAKQSAQVIKAGINFHMWWSGW
jgi:outer membrane immunogenic protein